jgi:hypothetical protein
MVETIRIAKVPAYRVTILLIGMRAAVARTTTQEEQ